MYRNFYDTQKIPVCVASNFTYRRVAREKRHAEIAVTPALHKMYLRLRSDSLHCPRGQVYPQRWLPSLRSGKVHFDQFRLINSAFCITVIFLCFLACATSVTKYANDLPFPRRKQSLSHRFVYKVYCRED